VAAFVTPLVIVHDQQIQTISLILQGQRGTGSFLVRDCVKVRPYLDGSHAIFHGPRCLGRYDVQGVLLEEAKRTA
jgi:hypothetical protein